MVQVMGPLGSYDDSWTTLIICMKMIEHEHTKCTVVVRQLPKTSGWGIQIPSKYEIFGKVKLGRKKLCSRDAAIGTTLYPPRTSNITPTQQFLRCPWCGSVNWLLWPHHPAFATAKIDVFSSFWFTCVWTKTSTSPCLWIFFGANCENKMHTEDRSPKIVAKYPSPQWIHRNCVVVHLHFGLSNRC